jgi:hypothetical protein
MSYVKNQPGEAVLDWPFCVTGGNGIGAIDGLCPYFFTIGSIPAMRRFHEKKVVGQYFGRLHPSQIEPYLQAGWSQMFVPDKLDLFKGTRQSRCFTTEEWSFFTDFYKFNDFAGINLYVVLALLLSKPGCHLGVGCNFYPSLLNSEDKLTWHWVKVSGLILL